jgi:hypothetical protein
MSQEDLDGPLYDLGILLVHGIGQTGVGETLLRFGEPLRKCIEDVGAPAPLLKDASVRATISAAHLNPEAAKGAACAELLISGAAATDSRWLLAEAWWAKKFPTPTVSEIVAWSFKVVPWTFVSHFDRQLRRAGFRISAALDEGQWVTQFVPCLLGWTFQAPKILIALAFLPFLLAMLALLTLVGIVPYAPVRNFARSVQRKLAATIGDSFVLMDQPIIAAAITGSVREDLEWLASRCKRIAVVAHSQGAAIAHRVLREPLTAPCDLFITFGSGLAKLDEIAHATKENGSVWLWMASAGALLAAACLSLNAAILWRQSAWAVADWLIQVFLITELGTVFTAIELCNVNLLGSESAAPEKPPSWTYGLVYLLLASLMDAAINWHFRDWSQVWFAAPFAAALAFTYLSVRRWQVASYRSLDKRTQWQRDRDFYRDRFQLHNRRGINWLDFFASADPVPNGPLLDDFAPKDLLSYEVTNAKSLLTDHTNYWKNKDDFLPRVANALLTTAGLRSRPRGSECARRRRWRVGWRVAARWALTLAAASLAYRWLVSKPTFFAHLAGAFPDSSFPLSILHRHPTRLVLSIAAALWAAAALLVMSFWRLWDGKEIDAALSARDYRPFDWRFVIFLVLLIACLYDAFWNVAGVPGLVLLTITFAVAGAVFAAAGPRNWLALLSWSGPGATLRELRLMSLQRAAEVAFEKKNSFQLTRVGVALLGANDDLAIRALSEAGSLGSANAAWRLGLYFDVAEAHATDAEEKSKLRQNAKKEFQKGLDLDDANCAWFLGYKEQADKNYDSAINAYRRAFKLGDVKAASSLGSALEQQNHPEEALIAFEEGEKRGDGASACYLADRLMRQSRKLSGNKAGDEAKILRDRAVQLYRRAFGLGYIDAALQEGDRCRDASDIAGARRAFSAGARFRNAACAYGLALLEEEEQQDILAARAAYALAIRLDSRGGIAALARYRLGRLFENEEKLRAAEHEFRAGAGIPGSKIGSADAAVSLGRLLEGKRQTPEARDAFLRAMDLDPGQAALPYVEFLNRKRDDAAAYQLCSQDLSKFPAEAIFQLGRLLRSRHPTEAKNLLSLALENHSAPAAVELYKMLMASSFKEADALLDTLLSNDKDFVLSVIYLLEKDQQTFAASKLKERLEHPVKDTTASSPAQQA